jgi:hypothetical protein
MFAEIDPVVDIVPSAEPKTIVPWFVNVPLPSSSPPSTVSWTPPEWVKDSPFPTRRSS